MRGRPRNKGPNPLTRSFESNGPDVKIRGTAQHIADKYAQLARDSQSSGDPVAAENYFQHAEHYYRMIAAAQEQFRQQYGTSQRPFDDDSDEGDEDGAPGNGFGYGERQNAGQMDEMGDGYPQPYANGGDRGPQPRYDRQDRGESRGDRNEQRGDRQDRGQRFDRGDRYDRQGGQDRPGADRSARPDRQAGERQDRGDRPERPPSDRQDRGERPDRQPTDRQDRSDRPERQANERHDRGERPERQAHDRPDRGERRERYSRDDRGGDQPRREFPRPERQPRADQTPAHEDEREVVEANLPAFLTNPVRQPITVAANEPEPVAPAVPDPLGTQPEDDAARPRTRRPRARRIAEAVEGEIEKTAE